MSLPREQSRPNGDAPPMDDAEQAMRRALGLYGDSPRPRPEGERSEPAQRTGGGGFMQGLHRRRFVQDGEVPVTVVRRDAPDAAHAGAHAGAHGGAHGVAGTAGPTSSRLQRVEAALANETAGRDRAERALHETQAALQALQTKMGHNDLAKNEALAASKRLQDEIVSMREAMAAEAERLRDAEARADGAEEELRTLRADLAEERRARKLAERLLRETAEESVVAVHDAAPVIAAPRHHEPVERIPARRGRPPAVHAEPEVEPEPVKWWLLPAKTAGKRR